jgi:membrane-bound lytic murein transglycosylase A
MSVPCSTFFWLSLFLSLCLPLQGCHKQDSALLLPQQNQIPFLRDDLDNKGLITAATRHLEYLETLPPDTVMQLGAMRCSKGCLQESMLAFLEILKQNPSPVELDLTVRERFILYQAGGLNKAKKGEMLVTGYYEPLLEGSLIKEAPFTHPLYASPASLLTCNDPLTGKKNICRKDAQGTNLPFWTRAEIENGNLLAGGELAYLKSPLDAFILHVQGSGKIRFPDGSMRAIQFATTNGREYKSIGKLLADEGKMSREEATMPAIRDYLQRNPDEQKRILHSNPRFVFFQWNKKKDSPMGSLGLPLTAGRSIAVDPDSLPTGVIAYLFSRKPVLDTKGQLLKWETMGRFVLPQDTGVAIKGSGRVDLFWGNGHYAEVAAGHMKEQGQLYFLVKKDMKNAKTGATLAAELTDLP